ncbi:C40 family peptidase [Psychroflexus sediminis]|uniref:TIGR02594 family protein n=1 Tax=Psychroflexus sediminis TaxID=470826 RepID=A0A1G7XF45_9FLAO|nr:TIGR02594 family protein [Psychroflexus sediminis]SDG82160.1 TIGR02594 family protein [Psychroflexus sediminis]
MKNLLAIASAEMGVKEVSGSGANEKIIQYAKDCNFIDYTSDETAWCSLFINWVAHKARVKRSHSLAARSWLLTGVPTDHPEPGDIVIFWRESLDSWKGHVGIFMGFSQDGHRIYCLGGNQGNQVSVTAYPSSQLLGFRRPVPTTKVGFAKKIIKKGDTGKDVIELQDALKLLGFNCGTSDGKFGPMTEGALKEFQATNFEVAITGIFDMATREFMISKLNSN